MRLAYFYFRNNLDLKHAILALKKFKEIPHREYHKEVFKASKIHRLYFLKLSTFDENNPVCVKLLPLFFRFRKIYFYVGVIFKISKFLITQRERK